MKIMSIFFALFKAIAGFIFVVFLSQFIYNNQDLILTRVTVLIYHVTVSASLLSIAGISRLYFLAEEKPKPHYHYLVTALFLCICSGMVFGLLYYDQTNVKGYFNWHLKQPMGNNKAFGSSLCKLTVECVCCHSDSPMMSFPWDNHWNQLDSVGHFPAISSDCQSHFKKVFDVKWNDLMFYVGCLVVVQILGLVFDGVEFLFSLKKKITPEPAVAFIKLKDEKKLSV